MREGSGSWVIVFCLVAGCSRDTRQDQPAAAPAPGPPAPQVTAQPASPRCLAAADSQLVVTQDSIGPLPVRASLEELRRLCPEATETVQEGGETVSPALSFPFGSNTAVASQSTDILMVDRPPMLWVVSGPDVSLPMGQSLQSRWGDLRGAYGLSVWQPAISMAMMTFCRYPRMAFQLDLPFEGEPLQPADVPDSAAVLAVWVNPNSNPTSRCK